MAKESRKQFRFEISKVTHDDSFSMRSPHSHPYYEIFYLVSGQCFIIIDAEKYMLSPGDIAFIKPGHLHQTFYNLGCTSERICLEFSEEYMNNVFSFTDRRLFDAITEYPLRATSGDTRTSIEESFSILLKQTDMSSRFSKELLSVSISQLMFLILGCGSNISSSGNNKRLRNLNVEKAMEFIRLNYYRKISLAEVAGTLHLNSSYFSKLFKDTVGKGFADYALDYRLVKSEEMLLETNKSITEIALSCGFGNSNYFCEAFKRRNRVTPKEFRKIKGNLI